MSDCIPTIDAGTYPEAVFLFWLDQWTRTYEQQEDAGFDREVAECKAQAGRNA
jgi:hypothetical protein